MKQNEAFLKILVPTDFSPYAEKALDLALAIADRFGSEVTLLHLYQVYSTTGMFVSVESYLKEDAAEKMLELMRRAEKKMQGKARLFMKIVRGDTVDLIADVADRSGFDLIVMGTQGAGGLTGVFTGSTTNGVVKKTRTPLLAVPAEPPLKIPQTIVLALDATPLPSAETLAPLVALARGFGARINVFHQNSGKGDAGIDSAIDLLLDGVAHSFHYQLDIENINASINEFAADTGADLLCMIRHNRSFLQEVFHVSATSREVFDSPVPLLVLQG